MKPISDIWIGVALLIATPFAFYGLVYFGIFNKLVIDLEQIGILMIAGMILGGVGLIYRGWKSQSTKPAVLMAKEQKFGPTQDLRPLAEGEIFQYRLRPNQRFFRRGDPVLFWAKFKGKLIDGYLATYIKKPDGTFVVQYDDSTVVNRLTGKGRLNGIEAEGRWSWSFPLDCKLGSYGFFIHAGNHYPPPSLWIRIKALAIHILWPSRTDFAKGTNQAVAGEWETVEVVE